ncbi:ADP-forming succinate--CoA ligase subunit beta [Criblamydia sequanensis]|uniref:Succinate--CoA ligase [ADP-forming] subunit beta n=1 Tax=Candidatus Criblamydia sequanensis CRIB-18 TaxID=1437425 RepID=A0A090DZX3_9BACT|nr:ADP-forming succinate--CoA ligase subunit beta [Criblamydia sequanensis]CDR34164.1 Succinyl-CoA ligase [ADP-forming] subunit beta [Criblamydia sequanensis CRIB-18]
MNVHEFQAKIILERFGVSVPRYRVVSSLEEAKNALDELELNESVIKVQIHAGGRGKAGGVKLCKTKDEALKAVQKMLGMRIINNQTGDAGIIANLLMISELTDIEKEYYAAVVIDRKKAVANLILSLEGGMDIEEVALKFPDKIKTFPIGLDGTLRNYQHVQIAKFMGWEGKAAKEGKKAIAGLAKAFVQSDASLFEINPLVKTKDNEIIALDAKLSVDDNALFRQSEIASFYDPTQDSASEARAKQFDLAYVALKGNIGCMVNGAGLAMATMDLIHLHGGKPANFLDVGGSASKEKVAEGFKIILADKDVKAILINIFGGIMNCETLALGVVMAVKEIGMSIPLVVRMEGTNVAKGKEVFAKSNLNITVAEDLSDAAEKAVALTKK